MTDSPAHDFDVRAAAYAPAWRIAAAVLRIFARGSLVMTLVLLLFSSDPPTNPLRQLRLFFGLFAAPEAAAWFIARAFAARVSLSAGSLVIEHREHRTEIPVASIAAVEPWTLPLPHGGVALKLKSGRHFAEGLELHDPDALAAALEAEGASPDIRSGFDTPVAVYLRAKRANPPGWLDHPILKFLIFSLVPALPAFRLHQFIAYGGTFGEYYTYGLQSYLLGFALWWTSFCLSLVVIAAGVRVVVEIVAFAVAAAAPAYAVGVRRGIEIVQHLGYYVGIPVWLLQRFLA